MNHTTEFIDNRNEEVWSLRYSESKKALQLAKENWDISKKVNYEIGEATSQMYYSLLAYWLSEPFNYLEQLYSSLDVLENTNEYIKLSRLYNIIATLFDQYGDYDKALSFCNKAIEAAEKTEAINELADALSTNGQIFLRINDLHAAVKSFSKSLKYRNTNGDLKAISSSLNLLGRTYTLMKRYKDAQGYYNKALQIRKESGDHSGIPWTFLGIATIHFDEGNYTEAISKYKEGLELNKKVQDKRFEVVSRKGIAEACLKLYETGQAGEELKIALDIAKRLNLRPLQVDIYLLLSRWAEGVSNYKLSHEYLKRYIDLKEEVLSSETTNKLRNQQITFSIEEARREAEIFQLKNVELKKAYDAIEEKNKQIIDSINYAQRIQSAILPSMKLFREYFPKSFIIFLPKDIVSGDFYWIAEQSNKVYFTVADCTGHGVPGAFVSVIGKIGLDNALINNENSSPAQILRNLNNTVTETFRTAQDEVKDGMDIALCAYNRNTKELEYAGAKNPLYVLRNEEITVYKPDRISIESTLEQPVFKNSIIPTNTGDRVFIFSDGIIDQFGGNNNKKFLQKRLKECIVNSSKMPIEEQEEYLLHQFLKWMGGQEQIDDVSLIGIEIN